MRIAAACPGDFHEGFDSLVRGEGRWWLLVLRAVKKYLGHDVFIIGQHNKEYYDEESGIYFLNLKNMKNHGEFDVVFSMDAWPDTGVDTNWISPDLNAIKTKQRVFAPFFNNDQANKHCTIPTVYPYYYDEGTCLPICPGSQIDLTQSENNFGKKNVVWFSKNSHENPEYLLSSFTNAIEYVETMKGALVVVDGGVLVEREYPDKQHIIKLLDNYSKVLLLKQWIPYSQMRRLLKVSAFITGIHHPVANPMSLDIVFDGGLTIQFENQRYCAPYNKLESVKYISQDKTESEDIRALYETVIYNKDGYEEQRKALISIANLYTEEVLIECFQKFVLSLSGRYS
jgi:hypothetical protein